MKEDSLLTLIRSMSKSEKIYFKKNSTNHVKGEKNDYLILFDHINDNNQYRLNKLKNDLGEVQFNQLSRIKNYLYESLLKSLTHYNSEHNLQSQLQEELRYIEILWGKGLYSQSQMRLERLKKKVIKYDSPLILIEVYSMEQRLLAEKIAIPNIETKFMQLIDDQNRVLKNYNILLEIEQNMRFKVFQLHLNSRNSQKNIEKRINLSFDEIPDGYTKIAYRSYEHLSAVIQGDKQLIKEKINVLYDTFNSYPEIIPIRIQHYIYFNYNRVLSLCEIREFKDAVIALNDFVNITNRYRKYCSDEIIFNSTLDAIVLCFKIGLDNTNTTSLTPLVKYCEQLLETPNKEFYNIGRKTLIYYYLTYYYFIIEDYKNSIRWSNKVIQNKELHLTYIYQGTVNLYILSHWLNHNFEFNEYYIKSIEREYKKNLVKSYENLIFQIIKKISIKPFQNKTELILILKRCLELITQHNLNDEKNPSFAYFPYEKWLNSKLESNQKPISKPNFDLSKFEKIISEITTI